MKRIFLLLLLATVFNSFGQCWSKLASGAGYSIATDQSGNLWATGYDNWGQLGNGNPNSTVYSFTQITTGVNWLMVSVGYNQVLAIKSNGTLWAWGSNQMGQLGDGTTNSKNVPTQIGTDTNWAFVSAGTNFSIAIKTNGTIWGFGMNNSGQLGMSDPSDRTTPTQIGSGANWTKAWAGGSHVIAKETNGTYWAWGANGGGQLGDGSNITRWSPVQIGTSNIWSEISVGLSSTVALKPNGTLWAWGWNMYGQLGNGNNTDSNIPIQVGTGTDWVSIDSGHDFVIAKKSNKSLWSWGNNDNGQLGLNLGVLPSGLNTPTQIGTDLNWSIFSASEYRHVLALKTNGQLWAWGSNTGTLGNGNFGTEWAPIQSTSCTLGIQENEISNYSVYPNPVSDILNVQNFNNLKVDKIAISDITGRTILEQNSQMPINVQGLQNGTYLLQIFSEGKVYSHKFIKQ